jgi:murein L,D-transpeptidase YcbB/YkuD
MQRACAWIALVCLVVVSSGCGDRRAAAELKAAVQEILAGKPIAPANVAVWKDVRAAYAARNGEPVWTRESSLRSRATTAIEVLRTAPAPHGLTASDYGLSAVMALQADIEQSKGATPDLRRKLANLDVRITAALMALGHDVALGRTRPEGLDPRWKARRPLPDFAGTFHTAADGNPSAWVTSLQPKHVQYAQLQKALAGASGDRARQIALNLERWRWLPDDFGSRYFLVNIPAYRLLALENGTTALDIRVVVGKPGNETPVFSSEMTTVVFSPYWNIPDTIVLGETAPAVARDPRYLDRHGIEILRVSKSGGETIDPATVNWDDAGELRQLAYRQRPGAQNALGHVKFMMPNPYDVYLHDTPADELFARPGRAFSHGCVRVEEPEALAKYVLRDAPEWDEPRMLQAMHSGVEKQVKLQTPIPVHIVYFTAWVDASGNVQFLPDVYKYDGKQGKP